MPTDQPLIKTTKKGKELTIEKIKEMIEGVCEEFSEDYAAKDMETSETGWTKEDCAYQSKLALSRFTHSPNHLVLNEKLLRDNQSIPAMFWRRRGATVEILSSPEKLLRFYLDKKLTRDGVVVGYQERVRSAPVTTDNPQAVSLTVSFSAERTAEYSGVSYTCTERMVDATATFEDLEDFEIYRIVSEAEENGEYFEETDGDYEYSHNHVEWQDSYDEEVDIDAIVYTDSEGNTHHLDAGYDSDMILGQCDDIESAILDRIEAEEEEEEEDRITLDLSEVIL